MPSRVETYNDGKSMTVTDVLGDKVTFTKETGGLMVETRGYAPQKSDYRVSVLLAHRQLDEIASFIGNHAELPPDLKTTLDGYRRTQEAYKAIDGLNTWVAENDSASNYHQTFDQLGSDLYATADSLVNQLIAHFRI